jgi:hypothetical protein
VRTHPQNKRQLLSLQERKHKLAMIVMVVFSFQDRRNILCISVNHMEGISTTSKPPVQNISQRGRNRLRVSYATVIPQVLAKGVSALNDGSEKECIIALWLAAVSSTEKTCLAYVRQHFRTAHVQGGSATHGPQGRNLNLARTTGFSVLVSTQTRPQSAKLFLQQHGLGS